MNFASPPDPPRTGKAPCPYECGHEIDRSEVIAGEDECPRCHREILVNDLLGGGIVVVARGVGPS